MMSYCLLVFLAVAVGVWGQKFNIRPDYDCTRSQIDMEDDKIIVTDDCYNSTNDVTFTPYQSDGKTWYRNQIFCKVQCPDGYNFTGRPVTICRQKDHPGNLGYRWLPRNQKCEPLPTVPTPPPTCNITAAAPGNGTVVCPTDDPPNPPYDINTACNYTCNEGYILIGDTKTICEQIDVDTAKFTDNNTCCQPNCPNGNVVFVMDRSSSVGTIAWNNTQKFVTTIIGQYEALGTLGMRFGVVVYDAAVEKSLEIALYNRHNQADLIDTIEAITWQLTEKNTVTAAALAQAGVMLENIDLNDAPAIVVLVTSGVSTDEADVPDVVKDLTSKNVQLFAVGSIPNGHAGDSDFEENLLKELQAVSAANSYIIDDENNAVDAVSDKIAALVKKPCCNTCSKNA